MIIAYLWVLVGSALLCSLALARHTFREMFGKHRPSEDHYKTFWREMWHGHSGQDIAEYAVMLAVMVVIVIGAVKLIGTNAEHIFSQVASSLQ